MCANRGASVCKVLYISVILNNNRPVLHKAYLREVASPEMKHFYHSANDGKLFYETLVNCGHSARRI